MSCFQNTKYECIDCNLPLCNRFLEQIEQSLLGGLAMKRVGHCLACAEEEKRLLAIQTSTSTSSMESSTGKSKKRTVNTNREGDKPNWQIISTFSIREGILNYSLKLTSKI